MLFKGMTPEVLQIRNWQAAGEIRAYEEGDRGGHGPKMGPNVKVEGRQEVLDKQKQ